MWLILEFLVLGWICLGGWLVLRAGVADAVVRLTGLLLAYIVGAAVVWASDRILAAIPANLVLRLAAAVVVGIGTSTACWYAWRRRCLAHASPVRRWLDARMPPSVAVVVQAAVAAGWLGIHLVIWIVVINLVAASSPAQADAIRHRTLVSYALLSPTRSGADPADPRAVVQQRFLRRIGSGLSGGVDRVLDASGTRPVMEAMDALRALSLLDDDERSRLLAGIPELQQLKAHPRVIELVADERVMQLVSAACGGSLTAIYALGDEPRIQALVEDPSVRAAMRAIDLRSIRERLAPAAAAQATPTWMLATLSGSLGLDARLRDPVGWTATTTAVLVWPGEERFALARTTLPTSELARELRMRTPAGISCWVAGADQPPARDDADQVVRIPAQAGGEVILLFDFGAVAELNACRIELRPIPGF